jgi:hypothetical protein
MGPTSVMRRPFFFATGPLSGCTTPTSAWQCLHSQQDTHGPDALLLQGRGNICAVSRIRMVLLTGDLVCQEQADGDIFQ